MLLTTLEISIHAPIQGAMLRDVAFFLNHDLFQSTHLYKVRCTMGADDFEYIGISIHAPIQGAILLW